MFDLGVITLDVDWAPDPAIDLASELLRRSDCRATWFVTHDSPAIRRLLRHRDLFEFGLHPNFLPRSSQGADVRSVMRFLRDIVPETRIMRSHSLFQSAPLFSQLVDEFGIETDVSLFLPGTPALQPHIIHYREGGPGLCRVPYFWEDDTEAVDPSKDWTFQRPRHHVQGMRIFNFHPTFIYLNASSLAAYDSLKAVGSLQALKESEIEPFRNSSTPGTRTFFDALVFHLTRNGSSTRTISELVEHWRTLR